jgi:putative membrane protein
VCPDDGNRGGGRQVGSFLIRWAITAGAVAVAALLVPGITVDEPHRIWAVVLAALILGLVNAFIRPIVSLLSCGCIVLTLGLFTLVINALMLLLAEWIAVDLLGLGFHIDGFWNALLGAVIISVVSFIASSFVGKGRLGKKK